MPFAEWKHSVALLDEVREDNKCERDCGLVARWSPSTLYSLCLPGRGQPPVPTPPRVPTEEERMTMLRAGMTTVLAVMLLAFFAAPVVSCAGSRL